MSDVSLNTPPPGALPPGATKVTITDHLPIGISPFRASLRRFCANRLAIISLIVLVIITLACFLAPHFYPFGPDDADFDNLAAPVDFSSIHAFGTDDLGRDLLLRVLDGGQVSLGLGFFGAFISVAISVIYGATAGYLGGRTDQFMMRTVDVLLSLPYTLLVIIINVVLGRSNLSLFVAVVVSLWLTPAVIARGQAVSLRHREFIEAARAGGMNNWQIISQHIAPNILNVVIVYSSLLVLEVISTESFLSFVGLGIQPPYASWGTLINDGSVKIETDIRLLLLPGAFLAIVLFCLNYITDGLRDAFDPNER